MKCIKCRYLSAAYYQVDVICAKEMDEIIKCKPECDQSSYGAKTKYYSQIGISSFIGLHVVGKWRAPLH